MRKPLLHLTHAKNYPIYHDNPETILFPDLKYRIDASQDNGRWFLASPCKTPVLHE